MIAAGSRWGRAIHYIEKGEPLERVVDAVRELAA